MAENEINSYTAFDEYIASPTESAESEPRTAKFGAEKRMIYSKIAIDVSYKLVNEYGIEELHKQEGYVVKYKYFVPSLLLQQDQICCIDCIAIIRLRYTRNVLFYLLPRDLKQLGVDDAVHSDNNEPRYAIDYAELSKFLRSKYDTSLEQRENFIDRDTYIYEKGAPSWLSKR